MKIIYAFFAATRYWPDRVQLENSYANLSKRLECEEMSYLITDDSDANLPEADCVVIIPMSGAVQQRVLNIAELYGAAVLYGAYIMGNAERNDCEKMLIANAAPALMDTWAVLRRRMPTIKLALNHQELRWHLKVLNAYQSMRGARILKIGETEPWVISNAETSAAYEKRFGVKIIPVPQKELAELYCRAVNEDAKIYYEWFKNNSQNSIEPTDEDLWNASRMAWAFIELLQRYQAQGAAIACFNLLKVGTNACLAVSYVNDCTDMVAACEGDMDSCITMLMMKKLTEGKLWMANPGIHPDGLINFSHCTAPIYCKGCALPCTLRNHHESGIGVSLQVSLPVNQCVTACRISDEASKITIQKGMSEAGTYEPACRTQMYVKFDDFNRYINKALGCHQVFAFEDIEDPMRELSEMLGLQII